MALFYIELATIAISLATIYICLKWQKIPFLSSKPDYLRIVIWLVALAIDAAGYFIYDYTGASYLAIMLLICIPFIFRRKQ